MPSIREFTTTVREVNQNVCEVVVQTPLAAVLEGDRDLGFLTKIVFRYGEFSRPAIKVLYATRVQRVTTPVTRGPSGVRRRLRNQPRTTDTVLIERKGVTTVTRTDFHDPHRLYWENTTSHRCEATGLSFDYDQLASFVRGVIARGQGEPLVDWLIENETEFAPFLTQPGWLPESREEFDRVKKGRDHRAIEEEAEPLGLEDWDEADSDLDRWR